jgi:hypothetical protein
VRYPTPEEGSCPSCRSMPPAGVDDDAIRAAVIEAGCETSD